MMKNKLVGKLREVINDQDALTEDYQAAWLALRKYAWRPTTITIVKADPGYAIVRGTPDCYVPYEIAEYHHASAETIIAWEIQRKERPPDNKDDDDPVYTNVIAIGVHGAREPALPSDFAVAIRHPDGHYDDGNGHYFGNNEKELLASWSKFVRKDGGFVRRADVSAEWLEQVRREYEDHKASLQAEWAAKAKETPGQ